MRSAMNEAVVVRQQAGIVGLATRSDVEAAVESAGVRVRTYPAVSDLPAHQLGRSIWLGDNLNGWLRLYALAHELGHFQMNHGLSLYTSPLSLYGSREEAQADAFAGVLILGYPGAQFDALFREAADAGMPSDCLIRVLNAVRTQLA